MCAGIFASLALALPPLTPGVPASVASLRMRDLAALEHGVVASKDPDVVQPLPAPLPAGSAKNEAETEDETPAAEAPHYGLTALGAALALLGGTAWYWRESDFNSRDWALHWDWPSWKAKLVTFDAVRLDDNHFDTNAFWHPLDGAGVYLIARGNGFKPGPSTAIVAAFSLVWEYLIEFREYPSVNDMLVTPLAAISLAEPAVRLADLLRAGTQGPVKKSVAAVLDPVGTTNDLIRGERRPPASETNTWGLPTTYRHRLDVFVGLGRTDYGAGRQRTEGDFGADVFVDATPGFGREGRGWRVTGPGALNFLAGGASVSGSRLVAAAAVGKVSLVGAQWRHFEDVGPEPHGQALFAGLATGFEYATRSSPTSSSDQLANLRVIGPMVEGTLARGPLRVDFVTDAAWDFAMVHPFGASPADLSATGIPTVIANEGYYYAQGLSLAARLRVGYGRWDLGLDAGEDVFRPIGTLDRYRVPAVAGTSDHRGRRRLWVGVRPWVRWPLRVMVAADQWIRDGRFGASSAASSELRGSTSLGLIF